MIRAVIRMVLNTQGALRYSEIMKMTLSEYSWVIQELEIYASKSNTESSKEQMMSRAMNDPAIRVKR